ncbi:MAG TPA: hypothetical protein VFV87_16670 [Pirellulaceae bacterium]|nr:hypothetical protein [Pirellulaceae bacterium]
MALCAASASAQDPFAAPPAGGRPMPMGGEVDPFAPGAARLGEAPPPVDTSDPTKREPLVIQQLRDSNPTRPAELMQVAQSAFQFGRPDETRRYLAKLLASMPAEDALAPLPGQFGDFLLLLTREEQVQPEGKQAADLVLAAAQKQAQDPDRIDALIAQLSNDDLAVRQEALYELSKSGTHVVTPALRVLADASREKEHRFIRVALAHLKTSTELPLLGALDVPNDYLKAQVILILGRMGSGKALMHLVRYAVDPGVPAEVRDSALAALTKISGPIPDRYEAERYLAQQTARLLQGQIPYRADHENLVELWTWDESKREVVPRKLPIGDASVLLSTRTANDLYALQASGAGESASGGRQPPETAADADAYNRALRLKLLTNLELAKVLAGLGQPLPMGEGTAGGLAAAAGPQIVSQVLDDALENDRIPAAIAAAEVLGQLGDPFILLTKDGRASPLAGALIHTDRRVRLAAALAAIKLDPGESFPGAGRVAPALGWIAGTGGESLVLVGHPRGEDAQTLVGFANELGMGGQAAYIGRTLAEEAMANPDYELILISDAIDLPPVKELVQWLRRDYRTAQIPVGVMIRGETLDAARFAFRDDPYTTVFPRIHTTEAAAFELHRLQELAGRNLVGRDERIDQARTALAALAQLASKPSNFARFELLRQEPAVIQALNHPALTADAAAVLAAFATPKGQTALVDFASQHTRDLAQRQAAAAAFAAAVKNRGLLLTQTQIAQQYARYNASERLDKPTQDLLGSILDAIEAPAIGRGDLTRAE